MKFLGQFRQFLGGEQGQLIRIDPFLLRTVLFAKQTGELLLLRGQLLQLLFDGFVLRRDDRFVLNNRILMFGERD